MKALDTKMMCPNRLENVKLTLCSISNPAQMIHPAQSSNEQSGFDENKKSTTEKRKPEKERNLQTKLSSYFTSKK